jgi:phosphoglycerate dehydrogenase-like enzyme
MFKEVDIKYKDKLVIAHDFNTNLKLYEIPQNFMYRLKKKFKKIEIFDIEYLKKNNILNSVDIFFGNRINNDLIKILPNLKWIHMGSVGFDKISIELLSEKNILLTNSKGLMIKSMTQHILCFIFMLSRSMHNCYNLRKKNILTRQTFDSYFETITDLYNKKILILGHGDVSKELIRTLKPFKNHIYTTSRTIKKVSNFSNIINNDDINKIISNVDFVINLLPLNNSTKLFCNKEFFEKMSPNSFFINVGRGETIDENHLYEILKHNRIRGAALDVFMNEPISSDSKLWDLDNLIITPHIAGLHNEYWEKQENLFMYNLNKFYKGDYNRLKNTIL